MNVMFNKPALQYDEAGTGGANPPTPPADWDGYLASLPAEQQIIVKDLYDKKNSGLLASVKAVRDERDTFSKELRDAARKAEKGSQAEKDLLEQATKLDEATKRADFMEEATGQECKNAKLAYLVAKNSNHFTKAGLPDWKSIKEEAPELFGTVEKKKAKGSAGVGTDKEVKGNTINDFIRARAGVNTIAPE